MTGSTPKKILVIEDEDAFRKTVARFLKGMGYQVVEAASLADARTALAGGVPDLVLSDLMMPDGDGIEALRATRARHPALPHIMMTAQGKLEAVIEALRLGAVDFLVKPFEFEGLARSIRAVFECKPGSGGDESGRRRIIGKSPELHEVWRQIDIFAPTDITILLLGPSGTGKELFARAIHARSKRSDGPFTEVDCASVPQTLIEAELFGHEKGAFTDATQMRRGKFELANGGTLFLDELGNLSLETQAKMLRVVQERCFCRLGGEQAIRVDVRIVGATNADLEQAATKGSFRTDLYYRLAEMPIRLPPLARRTGDIAILVEHFVAEFNQRFGKRVEGVSEETLEILEGYPWPGNIRELENVMRAAMLLADARIEPENLPAFFDAARVRAGAGTGAGGSGNGPSANQLVLDIPWEADGVSLDMKRLLLGARNQIERHVLARLLELKMSKAQMARALGLDYTTLLGKLKSHRVGGDE
jgi:DNA-binding NtrC family response regulator